MSDIDKTFLRDVVGDYTKVDLSDVSNLSNKVLPEQQTRKRMLTLSREMGCERDMLLLFAKYDKLMRNCTNEKERADIAKLGAFECYQLLGGGGELYVDGQLVYKDK